MPKLCQQEQDTNKEMITKTEQKETVKFFYKWSKVFLRLGKPSSKMKNYLLLRQKENRVKLNSQTAPKIAYLRTLKRIDLRKMKERVLLGMSGGIDSSVAAILLMDQGNEVIGITFRFWEEGENRHLQDAVSMAERLGIEHHIYDAREEFQETIIRYFLDEYMAGRTPFPCAKCNNEIKWNLILQEADRLGCSKVAMGHYAGIDHQDGLYFIREGLDRDKDQSFFLWGLTQDQLSRIVFPMADLTKDQVRAIAAARGFTVMSKKKDSLGVCFGTGDYRDFLRQELKDFDRMVTSGHYLDEEGNILGKHEGYPLYTVGQRRGLGIHLNRAVFVKELRPASNEVVLAPLASLYHNHFYVRDCRIVDASLFGDSFDTITRIRYRKQNTLSRIHLLDNHRIRVELSEPLESIAPGQTAVFYRDGRVLGGGFIE